MGKALVLKMWYPKQQFTASTGIHLPYFLKRLCLCQSFFFFFFFSTHAIGVLSNKVSPSITISSKLHLHPKQCKGLWGHNGRSGARSAVAVPCHSLQVEPIGMFGLAVVHANDVPGKFLTAACDNHAEVRKLHRSTYSLVTWSKYRIFIILQRQHWWKTSTFLVILADALHLSDA